ncbi:MAG: hypothetical protein WBE35_01275 [Candidatus Cybelea sp.]
MPLILRATHTTLCTCAAIALVAGCSASQGQASSAVPAPPNAAIITHAERGASWMAPDAKASDLLYIADDGTNDVYSYAYPHIKLKGTLTGFVRPGGECVDKAGDLFIADNGASDIIEYAHGGASPIAVLNDPGYVPLGCAVDPTSGNLAVTNVGTLSRGQGTVVIYKHARGGPKAYYTDPEMFEVGYCGYDNKGDLFVDGLTSGGEFTFAEIPAGGASFTNIKISQPIEEPSGVQWDGTHIAVGAEVGVIYEFIIKGKKGTEVGTTPLIGASDIQDFWIDRPNVIGADFGAGDVGIWAYPSGGSRKKTIAVSEPVGAVVSVAK